MIKKDLRIQKFLQENKLGKIIKQIRTTEKNFIFVVQKNNSKKLIKLTFDQDRFDNIVNEVNANIFIKKITPRSLPYYVPKSKLIKTKNYVAGVFEYLQYKSFAVQETLIIKHKPTKAELEKLFQILLFYYQIKNKQIPAYFIKKYKPHHLKFYFDKMDGYCKRPLNKTISPTELAKLKANMKKVGYEKTFQHHDFVLWNMFRMKNKIAIVDAEYTRHGIKWYDVAYFYVQTYIYFKNPEFAKKSLKYFVTRFEQEIPNCKIRQEIMFPMSYRITANLNESLHDKKLKKLSRELLEKILTNDFENLI